MSAENRFSGLRVAQIASRKVRGALVAGILAGITFMLLTSLVPFQIGRTIDRVAGEDSTVRDLVLECGVLAAILAGAALVGLVQERADARLRVLPALSVFRLIAQKAVRLRGQVGTKGVGEVLNLGLGDVQPVGAGFSASTRSAGGAAAIVAVAAVLLSIWWSLALIIVIGVPIMLTANEQVLRLLRKRDHTTRRLTGELADIAHDTSAGIRVIAGLGARDFMANKYRRKSEEARSSAARLGNVESIVAANSVLSTGLLTTAVVWHGAHLAVSGSITVGGLVAAYGYALFLATPVRWMLSGSQAIARARVSTRRVADHLNMSEPSSTGSLDDDSERAQQYLDDALGVLGYTAAAATDAPSLEALFEAARRRGLEQPADLLAASPQDFLFSGTVREIIDPTRSHTDAEVVAALEVACLASVVRELPNGLDYEMAAEGAELSGGERQRLRLARAIVHARPKMVMFEPTYALDATTEWTFVRRLTKHRESTSTLILANSPPHLSAADHVHLFGNGRRIAKGTHSTLLSNVKYRSVTNAAEQEA